MDKKYFVWADGLGISTISRGACTLDFLNRVDIIVLLNNGNHNEKSRFYWKPEERKSDLFE